MKRTFEIEFPDDCGEFWMNVDNLASCLRTETHVGEKVELTICDVTGEPHERVEEMTADLICPKCTAKMEPKRGCYTGSSKA